MRTIVDRPQDVALNTLSLLVAVTLAGAPWLLGFKSEAYPTWNAFVTGGLIAFFALLAMAQTYDWLQWVECLAGLWALGAPWALGFSENAVATWAHLAAGLTVIALAGAELWRLYNAPEARSV